MKYYFDVKKWLEEIYTSSALKDANFLYWFVKFHTSHRAPKKVNTVDVQKRLLCMKTSKSLEIFSDNRKIKLFEMALTLMISRHSMNFGIDAKFL